VAGTGGRNGKRNHRALHASQDPGKHQLLR
jgi:hypothetical protein